MHEISVSIRNEIILLIGKIRRLYLVWLRPGETRRLHSTRKGECARCGACCKLGFHCPFLKNIDGNSTKCAIHTRRPRVCEMYPVDKRDLRDRDIIMPGTKCGFYFEDNTDS